MRLLLSKLFGSPSYMIGALCVLAILLLGITTPEYLKYWYILLAMVLMNVFLYRHIVSEYSSRAFRMLYVVMFVAVFAVEFSALVVPYFSWNPFFRSVSTSLVLTYVLFMQFVVAVLGLGCVHKWYCQGRRKNLSVVVQKRYLAVAFLGLVVLWLCYFVGMFYGKNQVVVRKMSLTIDSLPASFEGYRVVQISDLHAGSMYDGRTMQAVVDSVNTLNPDVVAVTGDVVTLCSSELKPYLGILRQLKARDGVFAVLGNHDYSRYPFFPSREEKTTDSTALIAMMVDSLGWQLLNDECRFVVRGVDSIAIAGTQYIGLPSLSKIKLFGDNPYSYGNLPKALHSVGKHAVVLLTHNPVVWSREVIQKYPFVSLTLAGHTHAGQMGLYWKKYENQTAEYNSKTKAGLFRYNNQYLYINAGIGTSAMHSRFLILPEVTLITLYN